MVARCTSWAYVAAVLLLTGVSNASAKYSGGTGEPNDPYQIATAADLIALGETPADYDKHFVLTADIDLDPNLPGRKVFDKAVIAPDTDLADEYYQGTPFVGSFDGNRHTISHLTIKGKNCVGLFASLESPAEVRNLGVVDVNIVGTSGWIGALAGSNRGTVSQCYSTGAVSGKDYCVGGLVGANYGDVIQCHSVGVVRGTGDVVGGLVGENYHGSVLASYSGATVSGNALVGGLVGSNSYSHITMSYSTGSVSGKEHVGGLVGSGSRLSVSACIYDIQTSGRSGSAGGLGLTTAEMMDPYTLSLNGFGGDPNWVLDAGHDYPRLAWQGTPGGIIPDPKIDWLHGQGTAEDPFRLDTAEQLILFGTASILWDKHFVLGADIDLDPTLPGRLAFRQAVIPVFTGVLDGRGHVISSLTIDGGSYLGLFGSLGSGAEIKDLGVVDVNITGSGDCVGGLVGENGYGSTLTRCYTAGTVSGDSYVGGLVGVNSGSAVRCHSSGSVEGADNAVGGLVGCCWWGMLTECYSAASVSGDWVVGGLVGHNWLTTVTRCCSTGSVSGNSDVGGLVGWIDNQIMQGTWEGFVVSQCYSTGVVTGNSGVGGLVGTNGGEVSHCYSAGTVIGSGDGVGGLVGEGSVGGGGDMEEFYGSATVCFWDIQTSGQTKSAGGTGKTTAQMQTAKTFLDAGWDFVGETANSSDDIWWIDEGKDYPRLWWEPYDGRVTVELGQTFTVTLESNPSTGYRWEWVDHQDSIVEQMGEAQFKPRETGDPPLVGAGGWESFDFKAVHPGQMTLKLVYRRPWEEGVEPLKTFSLHVTVP